MDHSFQNILQQRVNRRSVLKAGRATAALSTMLMLPACVSGQSANKTHLLSSTKSFSLDFPSVSKGLTPHLTVAKGYKHSVLASWGDPLLTEGKTSDFRTLSAKQQSQRFGFNNDFLAYFPLNGSSKHGLLHVNHEYTTAPLMFTGGLNGNELTDEQMRIEMMAQGGSVIEVKQDAKQSWQMVANSRYARRITAQTPMLISGAAAGHKRLKTSVDPSGRKVLGTFANCAGGQTPWGTVLMSEENFDGYFNHYTQDGENENHRRYTVGSKPYYGWYKIDPRFDVAKEPNEPNRFGWVVEYDPYNPESMPVKRTALGRFKHETATVVKNADGRIVIYSGDDDYNEYIYRFVSKYKMGNQNANLLDEGTLSVAKFDSDGSVEWRDLTYGQAPLTEANEFYSQGDVLIETRRAADLLGATPMDRPEGIATHPANQSVYVSLTKNPDRNLANAANPRAGNRAGHILAMQPTSGDHTARYFGWDIKVLAGDPDSDKANYRGRVSKSGWFACPDNLAFHPSGSLWVATDGMAKDYQLADGLYGLDENNTPKCFLRAPMGAEVTGPCFTPDGETLFLSIQHPAEGSTFDNPTTRWPEFDSNQPPKPSVIAITKNK